MTVIIKNLAIAGYRSFGRTTQYFDCFSKVNLLIGRNNAGKSNFIRFLSEVYPKSDKIKSLHEYDPLSRHLPEGAPMLIGVGEEVFSQDGKIALREGHRLLTNNMHPHIKNLASDVFAKIYKVKKDLDCTNLCWTIFNIQSGINLNETWVEAVSKISDRDIEKLWQTLTNMHGGERASNWEPAIIKMAQSKLPSANIMVIPAIRQIGVKGTNSEGFDGNGIIERLARLQNPSVHNQTLRQSFQEITDFLRNVTESPEATIEVPYERDTINVHMDGKTLPLDSLGSGIHEVIILAVAATVLSNHVVCIEEPELHLNPILQRKLMWYLSKHTSNQYFITTHSAALMDTPGSEIYHIRLNNGASNVERVTSDSQKSNVCEDLGYHPSDLLQANCIILVEGPSDRIYLNFWIHSMNQDLIEGVHYSIMFYGGRLASHLSIAEIQDNAENFILLRKLNRRGMIVIDSDRSSKNAPINSTKQRLEEEFNVGPGHAWITSGREIENYLPAEKLVMAIKSTSPNATVLTDMGKYKNCLKIKGQRGSDGQASKVEVARYIAGNSEADFSVLDLNSQVVKMIDFIVKSNPKMSV